ADVVWFDALVTNPDRTVRNPNILVWHGRNWLIDHGASLYIQYTWRNAAEHARQPFERIRDHVLLPFADSIAEADERLAALVTESVLESVVGMVPDAWLEDGDPSAPRARYAEYLAARIAAPRAWAAEAETARRELTEAGVGRG